MDLPKKNPQFEVVLAEDSKLGADDASGLPIRLTRYSKAHHRAIEMSHYASDKGDVKISDKLNRCGSYLLFRDYHTASKVRLHAADFCKKHLLCPLCAIRRGAKMLKAYLDRVAVITAENPKLKAYLVTLTVKDGDDLQERFKHLHSSIQKLNKMRHRRADQGRGEAFKALGAVWSYEFKRGKNSKKWHPHVHCVWFCEVSPDAHALSDQWKNITGDSFIVDVRPFTDQDDLLSGFLEVFKYAVKFSDLPLEDNWHGYEVLSGKRLIASFGVLRGVVIPENLTDEPEFDDLPFVELMYRFSQGVGYSLDVGFKSLAASAALDNSRYSNQKDDPERAVTHSGSNHPL